MSIYYESCRASSVLQDDMDSYYDVDLNYDIPIRRNKIIYLKQNENI